MTTRKIRRKSLEHQYCAIWGDLCLKRIKSKDNQIFVGLPFTNDYMDFRGTLERTLSLFRLKPYFADQEIKEGMLFCKICTEMRSARMVFFEVTNWNPNVAFEAGMAIGYGKHVFFISKGKPFTNIDGVQRVNYTNLQDLEKNIRLALSRYKKRSEYLVQREIRNLAKALQIHENDPRFKLLYDTGKVSNLNSNSIALVELLSWKLTGMT